MSRAMLTRREIASGSCTANAPQQPAPSPAPAAIQPNMQAAADTTPRGNHAAPTASSSTQQPLNSTSTTAFSTFSALSAPYPTPMRPSRSSRRPIFVWDTETTGLSASKHRLVEVALQELPVTAPRTNVFSFSSLIHPGVPTPRASARIHGITNNMMQDSPPFCAVWVGLREFINDASVGRGRPILVAHNLAFDLSFLREELKRIEEPFPDWDFACSLRDIAHVLWPGMPASLKALGERFNVVNEEAHRAMSDVHATCEVLRQADSWVRERSRTPNIREGDAIRDMIEAAADRRRALANGVSVHSLPHPAAEPVPPRPPPDPVQTRASAALPATQQETATTGSRQQDTAPVQTAIPVQSPTLGSVVQDTSPERMSEEGISSETVTYLYVPNGAVYHLSRDCTALGGAGIVNATPRVPPGRRACRVCARGSGSQGVYIAAGGKLFHASRACRGLDSAKAIFKRDHAPADRRRCEECE